MLKRHFDQFAEYNRWANRRLYDEAARLPDPERRRDVGVFFRSLHGTLNHLLLTDRIWITRLHGGGEEPDCLNLILFEDFDALRAAREQDDVRLVALVAALSESDLDATVTYVNPRHGKAYTERRAEMLAHLFNHQTHHRGQAHAALTLLGVREPAPLDLLGLQRMKAAAAA